MVPHTTCLRLPAGRALVRAGEVARELIVILSGEAMTEGPGDRLVTLGPGTEIGGREALRHERHATTVVAATPLDVVVVTGPSLRWADAVGVARLAPARPVSPVSSPAPVIPMPRVARVAEPAPAHRRAG
jgi:CRP-like cAMP-binding protein